MGVVSPSNQEILNNSIGFVIPSFVFFIGRLASTVLVHHRLNIDDMLMCGFFLVYLALLVLINVSARFATNLFPPDQLAEILANPQDVHDRIIGSIIVIPLEQCMLLTVWGVKVCLIFFLHRMSRQLPTTRKIVYGVAAYVALGYAVIQISYYFILCHPFPQYYALPVKNSQCATYSTYSKIQMWFNISSDLALIIMPISIINRSQLPRKRKLVLSIVFSLGVFTIVCAILNKIYNFISPETTVYQLWYIREASVSMWIGNIVCCWQILQYIFKLRSFDNKHAEIQGRRNFTPERSAGGHTKSAGWYRRMVANATALTVSRGDKMEMFSRDGAESLGGTTVQDEKHAGHRVDQQGTMMSLIGREDNSDATLAIKYRRENDIV